VLGTRSSNGESVRGLSSLWPRLAGVRNWCPTKRRLNLGNAQHIAASVFIHDDNAQAFARSGLHHDYEKWLEGLTPHAPIGQYWHNRTGEDNAGAHLKRQVMGREVVVAVTNGRLDFGPWKQVFYGEFEGRRRKRVLVKIIGE
jgi:secondary thiamine-phosphate synthase enzyme